MGLMEKIFDRSLECGWDDWFRRGWGDRWSHAGTTVTMAALSREVFSEIVEELLSQALMTLTER